MNLSYIIIFVLVSFPDAHGQSLTSSGSEVKKPGESVTLSCVVSGLSLSWLHWIRQKPGRGLEWIGRIDSGTGTIFAQSLQGQFSITKDTSKNMVYLEIKSLKTEDTAVYYCARVYGVAGAFDYWGKGTTVTVSSDSKSPPNVFPMSQCQSSSDSLFIGCLASDSLNLKLKDSGKDLTGIIEYPPVKTGDKTFQVSLLSITKQKMEQSNITCDAENQIGKVSKQFKVNPQEPTLSLVPVITQKNTFAMCVIEDFYPMDITARWKENDVYSQRRTKLEYKRNTEGLFTAHSFYEVSSKTWNEKTRYTCEVTYQKKLITLTKNFKATFGLTLNPPIERELFVNNKTVLEAVVSGDVKEMVQAALVSCKVKDENVASITSENIVPSTDTSQFTKKHKVIIDTNKWFDGEYVTCTIHDTNNNRPIEQKIHFDKGDGRKPNATIYRPDDIKADPVSLVCKVTSSNLGNVYIMWKVGDESYKEGRTSAPIRQNDSTSILSILTIPKKTYEKPQTTVTCAVKHANMDKIGSPLQVTTSQTEPPEPEKGFALNCNNDALEEDEFRSLWSTATSFIFLFLFSLTYSAVLSLLRMKQ